MPGPHLVWKRGGLPRFPWDEFRALCDAFDSESNDGAATIETLEREAAENEGRAAQILAILADSEDRKKRVAQTFDPLYAVAYCGRLALCTRRGVLVG